MGESVEEATIVNWLKDVGDKIKADDFIVEVATDKVDSEVPCDIEGVLIEKCFEINDIVKVGETLCVIETSQKSHEKIIQAIPNLELLENEENNKETVEVKDNQSESSKHSFLSPLVRSIIEKEGISDNDLDKIKGSGKQGRLTKKDLLDFLGKNKNDEFLIKNSPVIESKPKLTSNESDTVRELTRFEKVTYDHMMSSKNTSVHAQMFIEADITNLFEWRENLKDKFLKDEKFKLTISYPLIKILSLALREFPTLNASLDDNKLILKKDINIGVATALGDGNLIVPVLKNADQLSLLGICKSANNLIIKARDNELSPDDVLNGTFTMTNIGVFESLTGTAILNQPQLGIIAFGSIRKMPRVIETDKGDFVGIRKVIMISLSFDHRIINGATGGLFLKRIKNLIEEWDINHEV